MPGEGGITVEAPPIAPPSSAAEISAAPIKTELKSAPALGNEQDVIKDLEDKVSVAKGAESQRSPTENLDAAKEAETKLPTKSPTIPDKATSDPEYKKTWEDLYAQAGVGGKEVDIAAIDKQALSSYYDKFAKTQLELGLPQEIARDPLYSQKLGEAMTEAKNKGEPLDGNKLSQEALARYQREKDLQDEKKAEEPQVEKPSESEARLKSLEDKIGKLSAENAELKQNMTELTSAMRKILPMILTLVQAEQAREQDPKKKEGLMKTLLTLVAVMALSVFTEGSKTVVPPTS